VSVGFGTNDNDFRFIAIEFVAIEEVGVHPGFYCREAGCDGSGAEV